MKSALMGVALKSWDERRSLWEEIVMRRFPEATTVDGCFRPAQQKRLYRRSVPAERADEILHHIGGTTFAAADDVTGQCQVTAPVDTTIWT